MKIELARYPFYAFPDTGSFHTSAAVIGLFIIAEKNQKDWKIRASAPHGVGGQ